MDFTWLSSIFNGLLSFIPRPLIIRATHGGVKWRYGYKVIELKPGWRWFWPLVSEVDLIVVARQTHKIAKPQSIETQDGITLAVGTTLIYSINDVVKAIGQRNWDVDSTINDITEAAVAHVIAGLSYEQIQQTRTTDVEAEITETCRRKLSKFGVLAQETIITDFARTKVKTFFGFSTIAAAEED